MWPRPREQTFVPPSHWGSIWNLALNKLWWAWVPSATYQATRSLALWFWRRRFLKGCYHHWRGGHLVMWPRPCEQTFVPPSHWGSILNLALIGQVVLEKKTFENGGRWTDDDGPWLFYKLTNEPKGSCELKMTETEKYIITVQIHVNTQKILFMKKKKWYNNGMLSSSCTLTLYIFFPKCFPTGADGMAKRVDPHQTAPGAYMYCLPRPVCPNI